jgi:5-methylcytosine-specific restriction endonuclease McrA
MNSYEKIRDKCKRCDNCNSIQQLEVHHKIFRSHESDLQNIINSKKDIFRESYWVDLQDYWIDDIENLVLLCAYCHKVKIHWGDDKLRKFYEDRVTINYIQIPFEKPTNSLY